MRNCLRCGKMCEESLFCASCQQALLFYSDEDDEALYGERTFSPDPSRPMVRAGAGDDGMQTVPLYSLPSVDGTVSNYVEALAATQLPTISPVARSEQPQRSWPRWMVVVATRSRLLWLWMIQPGKRFIPMRLLAVILIILTIIVLILMCCNVKQLGFHFQRNDAIPGKSSSTGKIAVHQSGSMFQPSDNGSGDHVLATQTANNTPSATSSSTTVPLSTVSELDVFPTQLSFSMVLGTTATSAQFFTLTNNGNSTVFWSASVDVPWLQLVNASGSASIEQEDQVSVVPIASALNAAGSYIGHVQISAMDQANNIISGFPVVLPVSLAVVSPCLLQPSVTHLTFSSLLGRAQSQSLLFAATGGCTYPVAWSVSTDQSWLLVSLVSGQDGGTGNTITVSVANKMKLPGTYQGQVILSCVSGCTGNSAKDPVTVSVTLTML